MRLTKIASALTAAIFSLGLGVALANGPEPSNAPSCSVCDSKPALSTFERILINALQAEAPQKQWFLGEYDFDNRGFNVLHFMGASHLPHGFSIWGFIDLEGSDNANSHREDLSRYFLEIDLKRYLGSNYGVLAELNDLQGDGNEIGRFGVFYSVPTKMLSPETGPLAGKVRLGIKYFPIETDQRGGQFSFNWNKEFAGFLNGKISAGGFFDLNYDAGTQNNSVIVTEHQVRCRVYEGLLLITEFRVNQFLNDDFGIAPGIQYRF